MVDATLGEGGHAREILNHLGPKGRLIGMDLDPRMLAACQVADARLIPVEANFRQIGGTLASLGIEKADAVLADLGISTRHYREASWGFSFSDGPLDMRLGRGGVTAADVVNDWDEQTLAKQLLGAGVKAGRKIAKAIAASRQAAPVRRTSELARIVLDAVGGGRPGKSGARKVHPATAVFRAIREAVTGELEDLREFIPAAAGILNPGGCLAILAYTSEEVGIIRREADRLVKGCICPPKFPVCRCGIKPSLRWISRKGVRPDEEEVRRNPAARSAGMFVVEKI